MEKHLNTKYGDGKVKFYKCDVSIDDQLFGAFNKVLDSHGYIDVVVNNAAVSLENSLEGIRRLVDINVVSILKLYSSSVTQVDLIKTIECRIYYFHVIVPFQII